MSEALVLDSGETVEVAAGPSSAIDAEVWHRICTLDDLEPLCGEAALVAGRQVALFRLDDRVFATDHLDPRTGAPVIARGIMGSRGDAVTVASPLYKEVYDLGTGECLSSPEHRLGVHRVLTRHGQVFVSLAA